MTVQDSSISKEPGGQKAPKGQAGRPPKLEPVARTYEFIGGLGSIQATKEEVAAVFRCTLPTLRKFFRQYPEALEAYEAGIGSGKASLRRRQWAMAEKNASMAIWLGKNWLGQKDRVGLEHTGKDGGPITTRRLDSLSDEELEQYEQLAMKLGADAATDDEEEDYDDDGLDGPQASGKPGDVPAWDLGGDPGGEGSPGYGEEPI